MLISGAVNGSFALPMRFTRKWQWENTWLAFSTVALLILPFAIAAPLLPNVWTRLGIRDLAPAVGFGLFWGAGQATFGIAIARVGMAMAFALVVGTGTVLGSLVPLAVLDPARLVSLRGVILLVSLALLSAGLAVYGCAARDRESGDAGRRVSYISLAICIASGVLGAAMNFGFVFSGAIERQAMAMGASARAATLAVWVPLLAAGYIPNLFYCVYLLRRNGTAACFLEGRGRGWALAVLMSVLWLFSTLGYGWGSVAIGAYGTSAGYAIYDSSLILWATILGVLAGEWRGVGREIRRRMRLGVALILMAVLILSLSVQ